MSTPASKSPLRLNDMMVYCEIHQRHTNMCYMGGAYICRSDKDRSAEELARCVCCQGRDRWENYFERVNFIQAEYETKSQILSCDMLRVYPTQKRVESDPFPLCNVRNLAGAVSTLTSL